MPDLLAGDPQKVEALVHLLASTGRPRHERARSAAAGRAAYAAVGCVACHGTRDALGKPAKTVPSSVPLGDLAGKYTQASLARFLQDPAHARPSGRMPKLLVAKEAGDVASYLLQALKIGVQGGQGTTAYKYYEGGWDKLPDFSKLRPAGQGIANGFDLRASGRPNDYALVFEGFFAVPKAGRYEFSLASDDGSRLLIDGKRVVDNDDIHPARTRSGKATLAKGTHKARVEFFQGGGGAELSVKIGGKPLDDRVSADEAGLGKPLSVKGAEEDTIRIDPALVAKGAALFGSVGCASCHQLAIKGKPVASALKAPALARLDPAKGCLAQAPPPGVPRYGLSDGQRDALAAAIKTCPASRRRAKPSPTPCPRSTATPATSATRRAGRPTPWTRPS